VGDRQNVLPSQMELAGASALSPTGLALPRARLFDKARKGAPVVRVEQILIRHSAYPRVDD
jgi:hypothetical protein